MTPSPLSIAQVFITSIVVACLMDLYLTQGLLSTASRSHEELRANASGLARWPPIAWLAGSRASAFMHTKTSLFPTVELVFGLLVTVRFITAGGGLLFLHDLLFLLIALPLALYSLLEGLDRRAPDELTLGGTLVGLLTSWMRFGAGFDQTSPRLGPITRLDGTVNAILDSFLGALVAPTAIWLVGWLYSRIRHQEGLGFGAVKTVMLVGAFLGLKNTLNALIIASVLGSIFGFLYIRLTGKDASTYPLSGVAIVLAGGAAMMFFQLPIWVWYTHSGFH